MMNDSIFLNFDGFHASELIRAGLTQQLNEVLEEAPYGSNITVHLQRRQPHVFTGCMRICAPAGRFTVRASGNKLSVLTDKLIDHMRKRLDKWKARRFAAEAPVRPREVNYGHSA